MKLSKFAAGLTAITATTALAGCGLSTNSQGTWTVNSNSGPGATPNPASAYRSQVVRPISGFHAIDNKAVCSLEIMDSQPFKVTVEGEAAALDKLQTDVKDGVLEITMDKDLSTSVPFHITIFMPKLDNLTNEGVGKVKLLNVKESTFSITNSGAGSLEGTGTADRLNLTLSGVGGANLQYLQAREVAVLLSGAGSASVYAKETLKATVSGIGKLTYSGNPPKLQKSVTGLGSISPL